MELTALPGVGPARAARLAKLGLRTVRDLLFLQPRRLERQGERATAAEARAAIGSEVSVRGAVTSIRFHRSGRRRSLLRVRVEDSTGAIDALFFNQPWLRERMNDARTAGRDVELYGRVVETRSGPALASPRRGTDENALPEPGTLIPHYPLTEGIGQPFLRELVRAAVEALADDVEEPLPAEHLHRLGLPALPAAVRGLHLPEDAKSFQRARRRVALESILALQARLARRWEDRARGGARAIACAPAERAAILARFPFEPTAGQRGVAGEIFDDLGRTWPMRRLLQGDVGAGKTLVGVAACLAVAARGGQSALMAPTELLAEQHYYGLLPVLERTGLAATLLTGSLPAARRRAALDALASGAAQLAVGTHALFSGDVRFRRLDLAVVDEQQRFGVAQRRELLEKGRDVHVLLMTATPIPRTLALTLYGDLEVSLLREKPPGRGELKTRVVAPAERARVVRFLRDRLAAGERAFWVAPRIEAEDDDDPRAAEAAFEKLARGQLREHGVELVHGRVPSDERAARLDRFRSGTSRLLVGTTIVEVGVDVPEATVMVVDGAERFGLAQLHQLRGRVGRGAAKSTCVLIAARGGLERCRVLEESDDGFAIAEEDLRRRGMGDLAGLRQAGESGEGLGDPADDLDLLLYARETARADARLRDVYLAADPVS